MTNFNAFGDAIAKRFKEMTATGLFRTTVNRDELWDTYLASFPPGANPLYKTKTEHDCTACRHFVKTVGGVVTIKDGQIGTLWDVTVEDKYQPVVDALAAMVRRHVIENLFLHYEPTVGQAKSFALDEGKAIEWRHFFVNLPPEAVARKDTIGHTLGETTATYDVMLRGLREITPEALDTVSELISQNSLYRGQEHAGAIDAFRKLQKDFQRADSPELFCWSRVRTTPQAIARLRNTAIGTLLVDLSNDIDIDDAVRSFEQKVAPTNYKRPTALVTKAMIAKAKETIQELGFMSALERRYATIEDITINNVLFADRSAKKAMHADVFDELAAKTPVDKQKLGKVEDVPIETFLTKILPQAESIEVFVDNKHAGNLVSLIAPADHTAKGMFKWPNNFSWSYAGEVTDSIKERVKRAGGSVTGDFRASLSWHNFDDLDLHLVEPGGEEIYYASKRSRRGGVLDVDMNAGHGTSRTPVENITYDSVRKMHAGKYRLYVNQFAPRESIDVGFDVELEFLGQVYTFGYPRVMRRGENVLVAEFSVLNDKLTIHDSLPHQATSRTIWGVQTQAFHKANVVMVSPNHWDGHAVGNKHYFFMLDQCRNEEKARGFFNEFLSETLAQHRKVLEVVGSKMKTDESDRQLSGLGFSSTQRNSLLVRVHGNFTRVVNVTF